MLRNCRFASELPLKVHEVSDISDSPESSDIPVSLNGPDSLYISDSADSCIGKGPGPWGRHVIRPGKARGCFIKSVVIH